MSERVELKLPRPVAVRAPVRQRNRLTVLLGRDWQIALPFVLPITLLMVGLIVWPFINAILVSFTTHSLVTRLDTYVGLDNYGRLLRDSDFLSTVGNTLLFTIGSLSIKFVAGMGIALILNSRLPLRSVLSGIMLLPWIVPEVVTALTWRSIYDPISGALNPMLMSLHLIDHPVAWLGDSNLALPSVIVVNVWKGIPFYVILLLAGLKAIPREQYEAAEVDGANVVRRFRHVTLPGLRYVILVTVLLSFISTFNTFGLVYLMTGGGPGGATRLFSILAYEKSIIQLRFGPGAATALSMAPFMAILIFVLARVMRPADQEPTGGDGTLIDRALGVVGALLGTLFDVVVWPFEWLVERFSEQFGRLLRGLVPRRDPLQPLLRRSQRANVGVGFRVLILLPILLFVLFPFYWIVITSFKTDLQIQTYQSLFWPNPWTLDQHRSLLEHTNFLIWFRNTVIVASMSTAISIICASMAAYALTRLKFSGGRALTTLLLISYLLPGTLLFIPLYRILTDLGLINTYGALFVTYPTFLMPFATWVLMGYFRSIPAELEEAALIDGATRLTTFRLITLPLAAPALLSVTLFAFTNAWNEFLYGFVFITSENLKTLPVGLQLLVFGDIYPWGRLMAASLLMAIPVVAVYIYAQRFLVEGLTAGGLKG